MENWKLKEIEKNLMIAQGVPYYWECKDTVFKEEFSCIRCKHCQIIFNRENIRTGFSCEKNNIKLESERTSERTCINWESFEKRPLFP